MRISAPSLRGARPRHVSKVRALVLHGSHPAKQITVPNNDGAEVQGLMETTGVMQRLCVLDHVCSLTLRTGPRCRCSGSKEEKSRASGVVCTIRGGGLFKSFRSLSCYIDHLLLIVRWRCHTIQNEAFSTLKVCALA